MRPSSTKRWVNRRIVRLLLPLGRVQRRVHHRCCDATGTLTRPLQIDGPYSATLRSGLPAFKGLHSLCSSHVVLPSKRFGPVGSHPAIPDGTWFKRFLQAQSSSKALGKGSSQQEWETTRLEVPVGGSGSVILDISNRAPVARAGEGVQKHANHVLIYLPSSTERGDLNTRFGVSGSFSSSAHLKQTGISTLIRINYRLSAALDTRSPWEDRRFPSPIHDVSVAFEWILENWGEITKTDVEKYQPSSLMQEIGSANEPRVSIYGSHIGGSLALMLALTQPNDIHSVFVRDPIVDWTGLDDVAASANTKSLVFAGKRRSRVDTEEVRSKIRSAAEALIDARTALFRNPSGFFDPFASPLLFLRAPGTDTPTWRTAKPEADELVESYQTIAEVMKKEGGVQVDERQTRETVHERGYGPYDDDWPAVETGTRTARPDDPVFRQLSPVNASDVQRSAADLSELTLHEPLDGVDRDRPKQQSAGLSLHHAPNTAFTLHQDPFDSDLLPTNQPLTDLSPSSPFDPFFSPASTSDTENDSLTPRRRRKVLRRWPPVGRPEDVELPFVNIYSTIPRLASSASTDNDVDSFKQDQSSEQRKLDDNVDLSYVLHLQAKEMADVMRRACFFGREKGTGDERVRLEAARQHEEESGSDSDLAVERALAWFTEVA